MDIVDENSPIEVQLRNVEYELKNAFRSDSQVSQEAINEIFDRYFQTPKTRVSPALVLLSAGIVNSRISDQANYKLVKLAAVLELIHSSNSIQKEILKFKNGRKKKVRYNTDGGEIATLAGDVLHSRMSLILSEEMPQSLKQDIMRLTGDIKKAEDEQSRPAKMTKRRYLSVSRGKTAEFMSACCRLGGMLAGADSYESEFLSDYGLNLGMTYQLMSDMLNRQINWSLGIGLDDAEFFANNAMRSLDTFDDSFYKERLLNFVGLVMDFSRW